MQNRRTRTIVSANRFSRADKNPGGNRIPKIAGLIVLLTSVSSIASLAGCIAPKRTPNLDRIFSSARAKTGKRPVFVIPGILGTQLINSKTGEIVWPSAIRSSDERSFLPMTADLANNRDDVMPTKIVETVRLARMLPEVYVYRDLLNALRNF